MANERYSDLTTAELMEYVAANPSLIPLIAQHDPRVKLMEALDKNPVHRKALRVMGKQAFPNANVPEVDIPAQFEEALVARDKKIEALEAKITAGEQTGQRKQFRADLAGYAEALGFEAADKELDEIEAFMVDNHFGPKAASVAVEKFYETRAPAEPNADAPGSAFNFEDADSKYLDELRKSPIGSDTSALTIANATRLANEMGVFGPRRRSPAFAGR